MRLAPSSLSGSGSNEDDPCLRGSTDQLNDNDGVTGSPLVEGTLSPAIASQLPPAADPVYESLWHFGDRTSVCGHTSPPTLDQESMVYERLWQFDIQELLDPDKPGPMVPERAPPLIESVPPEAEQKTMSEAPEDRSMLQRVKAFFRAKEMAALAVTKDTEEI